MHCFILNKFKIQSSMKNIIFYSIVLLFLAINPEPLKAQHFAREMHFSPDKRKLITGNQPYKGFYKADIIHTINIQFSDPNYWNILTSNFPSRTDMPATVTIDGVVYDSAGVRFKGNSSYSNITSSQKKSFNIALDDWKKGQNVGGYNTVVLNNGYSDPSFAREVVYEKQVSKHAASPKGNFAHLYLNGQDWGLYSNVEQLNHDFEKEWFRSHTGAMWRARNPPGSPAASGKNGDSLSALYDFGTDTNFYSQHYYLKSSAIPEPDTKLMTAIRVLDTVSSSNIEQILGDYIDIDQSLWLLASENGWADDDSYLFKARKDYYIYYEPESNRLIPLEMDGNDVFNTSYLNTGPFFNSTNPNFALMYKLLNIPVLRQRYLAHLRTVVYDELDTTEVFPMLDLYHSMVDSIVFADPKKLYTYSNFTGSLAAMKSFVIQRINFLLADAEVNHTGPVISNVIFYGDSVAWQRPHPNTNVWVTANVTSPSGINQVSLYSGTELSGKFSKITMIDDGLHHDQSAGDGIYGATISGKPGATWVRFYVEATANDAPKTVSYEPTGAEHDVYVYLVLPDTSANTSVVINELMAKNISSAADSSGQYDDWIELYNNSNQSIDISGYYLTDSIFNLRKWKFPQGTIIPANGYQIVWADETENQGRFHTNFKLSSTQGEILMLMDSSANLVDQVTYGQQQADMGFARVPNGIGSFIIQAPTFATNNNPALQIGFHAIDSSGCSPFLASFVNTSLNAISYSWSFGDSSQVDHTNAPTHLYTNPGTYTCTLIATSFSDADTISTTIHVLSGSGFNFPSDTIISPLST